MDFTEDEVAEMQRLIGEIAHEDQPRRIDGRLQVREFESKHGRAKTLAMYDHLEGVTA